MQIRVAGIAIPHVRLMMAAAGTQRARPTGMAIVLGVDMPTRQKVSLRRLIDACRNMAQLMRIGIDKAMARRDIARRADSNQTQTRRRKDEICLRPDTVPK